MNTNSSRMHEPCSAQFRLRLVVLIGFILPLIALNSDASTPFVEVKKFTGLDTKAEDYFGGSLDMQGDLLTIGAIWADAPFFRSGAVYLFKRDAGGPDNWGQIKKLTAADAARESNFSGPAISGDGNTIAVGASADDEYGYNAGAAYVFDRNEGGPDNWGQAKKIVPLDIASPDNFHAGDISFDGNTLIGVGHRNDDQGTDSGSVYVFERDVGGPNNWGQVKKILPSDGRGGDVFGIQASLSRDTLAVGAWGHNGAGPNSGAVYIFERNRGGIDNWGEVRKILGLDTTAGDKFGWRLSLNEDTLLVGVQVHGNRMGAAYIFDRNAGGADNWGQIKKLIAPDGKTGDLLGSSVRLVDSMAHIGAAGVDRARGASYVYQRDAGGPNNWGFVQKIMANDADPGSKFGSDLDISNGTLVVGAFSDSEAGADAGAAYIFESEAVGPESVGGSVTGLVLTTVECANINTGQTVSVPVNPGQFSWNCDESGFEVAPGDRVIMTVDGAVPRDGDLNGDGCVDRSDAIILRDYVRGFGSYIADYDINDDGSVNIADVRSLVLQFDNPRGAPCD